VNTLQFRTGAMCRLVQQCALDMHTQLQDALEFVVVCTAPIEFATLITHALLVAAYIV
jgi:hypothetical protein